MNTKKQNIINAAYSLFINKGFNAASIQDILDEAGVSKGTFYNYFTSKTECLMAIMESIASEIRQKRMAAAAGKPLNDPQVLADQLSIRIHLNHEKNLFSLYESIFYSQDVELKKFAKITYMKELDWITSRIIDIFGKKAEPYALDNAAILHGSIQQLIHLWKLTSNEDLPTGQLAAFVVRRLEANIASQIASGERFIKEKDLSPQNPAENLTLKELGIQLQTCSQLLEEDKDTQQLISFLAAELALEEPRKILIESVLGTLATNVPHETEIVVLLEQVWKKIAKLQ